MALAFSTLLGKSVLRIAKLRGGGSALPGLFVEKIDPEFMKRTLEKLPWGVVLISGTNGKTTTTKMVVELLESQGMKVFTNRSGSNFTRGVAAALLAEVDQRGMLDADIAVLELDEAHAVHFVNAVQPRYCLLLNVMRDQLDRFGEIDYTANLLHSIARATTHTVVLNRDDPRLGNETFYHDLDASIATFGVTPSLLSQFPSDDTLREANAMSAAKVHTLTRNDTCLRALEENHATIEFDGTTTTIPLQLNGIYNTLNAVGAVALTRAIAKDELDTAALFSRLSLVTPAFGRGETLDVNGKPLTLVLVKNPGGFRLGLKSFSPVGYATMIAINDNYADGRDMSWLWDVDFESLKSEGVAAVSGIRAYDMALRLQYDEIELSRVDPSLPACLKEFLRRTHDQPKRIYCTYTAMLTLRKELAKITKVNPI